ncbi:Chitin binding Peritrophin-A domain [Seminavis robusta]|uniref:Chitin binding Peritrophin-A domain n=1 Tax=Seminavis robusta TaxID=568900 RepID=A0A9N8DMH0_9STRA|nr:Chitin binding Peritrophin-A domain [Seminavis robusta]|eukprot:Sro160_g072220.1 Chitin binding Peritrophin-A domain (659) ;mRNA; r:62099-64168
MKIISATYAVLLPVWLCHQGALAAICGDGSCDGDSTPAPAPPSGLNPSADHSRMIAYVGNWQSCPTAAQLTQYTHIVIGFAVSYTDAPGKNNCSPTCEIATPPICNNAPNPALLGELKAQGKKILVSFGGAGMGGSWAGDQNDCWEYCYGRETQVASRLTAIVDELGADGVDIDYEYFYEDNQNGSGFNKGTQAQNFLTQVTVGLRNSLASDAIVTHAPMDVDLEPNTAYFQLLKANSHTLDFIMPQYYNGMTRPVPDGIGGTGQGSTSALEHYNEVANQFFGGDATRMVFGFCINDCSGTGSNANAHQAAQIMTDLSTSHNCHGGAFFWVAIDDTEGSWSSVVNQAITTSTTCSLSITPAPVTSAPPPTKAPTPAPVSPPTAGPTAAPVTAPDGPTSEPCCPPGYTGLLAYSECAQYYYCVNGAVVGTPILCTQGSLFDTALQYCNWSHEVSCNGVADCNDSPPVAPPTKHPSAAPVSSPPPTPAPVTMGSPTKPPTPAPVSPPTAGPTATQVPCNGGATCNDSPPAALPTTPPTKTPSAAPVSSPPPTPAPVTIGSPTKPPTPAPVSPPTAGPTAAPGQPTTTPVTAPTEPSSELCCPPGYTGLFTYSDCSEYYSCFGGAVFGGLSECPQGTLFDVEFQMCNWGNEVSCNGGAGCN